MNPKRAARLSLAALAFIALGFVAGSFAGDATAAGPRHAPTVTRLERVALTDVALLEAPSPIRTLPPATGFVFLVGAAAAFAASSRQLARLRRDRGRPVHRNPAPRLRGPPRGSAAICSAP